MVEKEGTPQSVGEEGVGRLARDFGAEGLGTKVTEGIEPAAEVRVTVAHVLGGHPRGSQIQPLNTAEPKRRSPS